MGAEVRAKIDRRGRKTKSIVQFKQLEKRAACNSLLYEIIYYFFLLAEFVCYQAKRTTTNPLEVYASFSVPSCASQRYELYSINENVEASTEVCCKAEKTSSFLFSTVTETNPVSCEGEEDPDAK